MDSKRRIVLGKRIRRASGIGPDDDLVAFAFHGGILITSTKGKHFAGSLTGFHFEEEKHDATKYLEMRLKDAST